MMVIMLLAIKKAPCGAFLVNRVGVLSDSACWRHADCFAVKRSTGLENHVAVSFRKQGVVTAHADVRASVELGAALTYQDVAGDDCLTTEFFNAKSFRL
jgi:hypothetical protein